MHEVVRSNLHTKLPRFLRLSSLAGTGLPERMRSTAFAFLGLTAALGLALVAIFAQLNFPLLSPAPLPGETPAGGRVSGAVALGDGPGAPVEALQSGIPAPAADTQAARRGTERSAHGRGGETDVGATAPVPVPSRDGADAEAPESPAPAPPSDTSTAAEPAAPTARAPEAEPAEPAPGKPGGAEPKPSKSAAGAEKAEAKAAKDEAKAAAKAEKTDAKAAAKGEKAAPKAPEAESGPVPASPPPAPPAPEATPGNGKGKALGHDK